MKQSIKSPRFHSFRNSTQVKASLPKKKLLEETFLDTVDTHSLFRYRIKQICSVTPREQTVVFRNSRNMQVEFWSFLNMQSYRSLAVGHFYLFSRYKNRESYYRNTHLPKEENNGHFRMTKD